MTIKARWRNLKR